MHRPRWQRLLPTLALVLVLGVPCLAAAAQPRSAPQPTRTATTAPSQTLMSRLWSWAAALFAPGTAPGPVVYADAGCGLDPNGHCLPPPTRTTTTTNAGCGLDPDGHCRP
ncbi:MAG: hypothetical protein M3O15_01490 [Acidobacteriota bacterium]|nr:hypothetical protein [Acidobacteriota bacterium]